MLPRRSLALPPPLPVVAPATNTDTQPPNNVRLPKLTLPKFSGDSLEWQTFWDTVAAGVDQNTTLSGVQKFHYLRAQLSGTAAHCIAGLTATNANYEHAMDRMQNSAPSWITGARHVESSFASFATTSARSRSTCTCTSIQILAKFVA